MDVIDQKIEKLQEYKEQWESVSEEYQIQQDILLAEQILGADWESQILDGRMETLENFKNEYVALMQEMADAAWESANEQIRAAKEAAKGAGGSEGGAGTIGGGGGDDGEQWEVVYEGDPFSEVSSKTFSSKKAAEEYIDAVGFNDNIDDDEPSYYAGRKFAKGGVITSKKSNPLDLLAKREGEDVTIFAKEGERVLTPVQNEMWEKWTEALPNLQNLASNLKINVSDYSHLGNIPMRTQPITQHNQFNVSLPNITDNSKAIQLLNELQQLPLDALQHSYKK